MWQRLQLRQVVSASLCNCAQLLRLSVIAVSTGSYFPVGDLSRTDLITGLLFALVLLLIMFGSLLTYMKWHPKKWRWVFKDSFTDLESSLNLVCEFGSGLGEDRGVHQKRPINMPFRLVICGKWWINWVKNIWKKSLMIWAAPSIL